MTSVTNEQLYLAIGIPMLFNAGLIGLLLVYINARFDSVDRRFTSIDQRFTSVDQRFTSIDQHFTNIDQRFTNIDQRFAGIDQAFTHLEQRMDKRFDELKDLWRAELRRVEEVIDARLKHLEER